MAFTPLAEKKFDVYKAAHLLGRAGFGGTWDDARELQKRGLQGALDWLINLDAPKQAATAPECAAFPKDEVDFRQKLKAATQEERQRLRGERRRDERERIQALKLWWLNRMLTSTRPLEERMTLFWHSHFASSFAEKIETTYPMWQQNEMFRRFALGKFHDQLRQLIRNPAMLVWLDNAQSFKGRPNENFARELMELFSIGVGNYTEKDVKEGARALTGYGTDRDTWTFEFRADGHDAGDKTYLGNTGDWSGDDVVQFLCEQPSTSRFMCRKFLNNFLWADPDPELVEAAAKIYRENDLSLAPLLRRIFASEEFYSGRAEAAVVKSPVVLTIGALKSMRVPIPAGTVVTDALRLMGQDLFFPPEVNGWVGGTAWINSNMLLVRYNFANFLINGVSPDQFKVFDRKQAAAGTTRRNFLESQRSVDWSPREQIKQLGAERKLQTAVDAVEYYVHEFLQRPASAEFRGQLVTFLETDAAGGHKSFSLDDTSFDERVRGLVHLIMSSPDFQLC